MTDIKPRYVDGEPVCSGGNTECQRQCMTIRENEIVYAPEGMTCIPGLRQQRDRAEARVKELEAELRGDVDSLICKCGCEDCDAVIAEYDVEDCSWTDTHRIEKLRAIILERHYDESPSEARVKKLEERLERVRDIYIGWSGMKEYTRTERRILAQLRDALAATEADEKNKFGMTAKDRRKIYEVAIARSEEILNGEADDE